MIFLPQDMITKGKFFNIIKSLVILVALIPVCFGVKAAGTALTEVPFHKGVNVNGWFDRPADQVDMAKYKGEDFDFIKHIGMDVVRLPINFHSNIGTAPTYTLDEGYLTNLDAAVDLITSRGLWVILDHHSLSVGTFPSDGEAMIRECCKQLAKRYKGRDRIVIELFNEPFFEDLKQSWPAMQGRIINAIRACDPDRILIATPWGCQMSRLSALPEYNDPRVIYTFHFYEPMMFTHQGAYWSEFEKYLSGFPFPYSASRMPGIPPEWQVVPARVDLYNDYAEYATAEKIRSQIQVAVDWAKQHGKLLYCGELGVLNTAAPADRYRWYKVVGDKLAETNIPWTLWQYKDQLPVNFSIFSGSQIFDQLDTEMMRAMGVDLPEEYASGPRPLSIYGDGTGSWCNMRTDRNGGAKYLDYYCKDNPAEGNECIRYNVMTPNGGVWFEIWLCANVSNLRASGANLEFMARTTDKIKSLEFYFQHYVDGAPRQWRMSATVSSDGNASATRQLSPDGEWHKISIPLSEMQYHGCDGEWKDCPDEGEAAFDWSRINWLMITPAGDRTASGKTIYLDDIRITAPQNGNKVNRQCAVLCSENLEIDGVTPGWHTGNPYIIDRCNDGTFRCSARFGKGTQTWQMFTGGIESGDENARNATALVPDLTAAFRGAIPEDLKIGNAYNSKYLMQAVGKTVPLEVKEGQGFQVTGNGQAVIYNIVMPADLSTMTIESVSYPETLYLYGDAAPDGWSNENPTAMENLGNGLYRYSGELKAGNPGAFQIHAEKPAVCGTNAMALGPETSAGINCRGVSEKSMNFYETDRPDNCYYRIQDGETNNYIVTVDVAAMTIDVQLNNLYIAYNNAGKDFTFKQMESEGEGVFTYKGYFPAGNTFTFAATEGWTTTIAPEEVDVTFGLARFTDKTLSMGSPYTMTNLCAGTYIISADLNNMTLTTCTYNPEPIGHLYVAGNGAYNEMNAEGDGVYSWSGELDGGFTITTTESEYPCYMPAGGSVTVPETGLAESEMVYNPVAENGIGSWTGLKAGNYKLTVNLTDMILSVERNVNVSVVGSHVGKDISSEIYYDLTGRKVRNPGKGIYIRQQCAESEKVIIK